MKKAKLFWIVGVLLLLTIIGLRNRAKPAVVFTQVLNDGLENAVVEDMHQSKVTGSRIIREYPSLGVFINAECLSPIIAREIPSIQATFSMDYSQKMADDFLFTRYPEAQAEDDSDYEGYPGGFERYTYAVVPNQILAYYDRLGASVHFYDSEMDVNDSSDAMRNIGQYRYFTEESQGEPYTSTQAIAETISALQPYTDFELNAYNVIKQYDDRRGRWDYRIQLELCHGGIPISRSGPDYGMGVGVGIQESGIGYFSGTFNFSQICENGSYSVLSLADAISAFEKYIPMYAPSLRGTPDVKWNIRYIQLEYCPALCSTTLEYTFRPVWCFYGRYSSDTDPDFYYDIDFRIYADTGEFCDES